jgi:4-hydroxybenzoate polyprenyltransferase
MLDYLKLVRYKNLLIIILTQYLMRWCVIYPFERSVNLSLQFSEFNFFLLVLSTVFIAAAGYAINDYFDIKVDLENHPNTVVVGTKISRVKAMSINNILNLVGVVIGFWISWSIGLWKLGFVFIFTTGILWFYSALYKRQLIIGNIIVALFASLVPLLTVIFEIPMLNKILNPTVPPSQYSMVSVVFIFIAGYSVFAFLTTLAREILKDIEDISGDSLNFRKTIPVIWGILYAKIIVVIILIIVVIALALIYFRFFNDNISVIYILIFIVFPIFYIIYKTIKATQKSDYRNISFAMKIVMLFGLMFSVLLHFILY